VRGNRDRNGYRQNEKQKKTREKRPSPVTARRRLNDQGARRGELGGGGSHVSSKKEEQRDIFRIPERGVEFRGAERTYEAVFKDFGIVVDKRLRTSIALRGRTWGNRGAGKKTWSGKWGSWWRHKMGSCLRGGDDLGTSKKKKQKTERGKKKLGKKKGEPKKKEQGVWKANKNIRHPKRGNKRA